MQDGRDIALEAQGSESVSAASEHVSEAAWAKLVADWFAEQSELVIRELERDSERE